MTSTRPPRISLPGPTLLQENRIARYSQAVLARTKTDAADARRIARFCE